MSTPPAGEGIVRIIDWARFAGEPLPGEPGLSVSIGVFDGVHRGHQELIRRITARSPASTVITFRQNPKQVLAPDKYHGDIFSLKQKLETLESLGVSRTVLIDFSGNFSKLTGKEFIGLLKQKGRIAYMALGTNFRCGCRLDTDARSIRDWMTEEGVCVDLVEPVMEGRRPVSSSRIRAAVSAGDLALAAALLGRPPRIDVSGMALVSAGEGRVYDAADRVTPPPGAYRAAVRGGCPGGETETEVSIKNGKIFIPVPFEVESIEFKECNIWP
jgi:riboflavin kinase/FMN adenylyltransferase